jgi:molybdopterin molybdotransferase
VVLPVDGDIPAGARPWATGLASGRALRIMTGAPLPAGAEAVVPVEWTDGGTVAVQIRRPPTPGQHLRGAGEDVRAGELVLTAGTRIGPRQLALLAALGRDRVRVTPRPRVVVLPSGSELVPPGRPLRPGQIHDSNGYGLVAAAAEAGALAEHGGIIGDESDAVQAALLAAAERADLVITTGGVSAGAFDTVKEVLRGTGTVRFDRVAMQPGMPQGVGTIGSAGPGRPAGTPIITLPGNPVSALVSFEVFVRPVLQVMQGGMPQRATVRAVAAVGWDSPAGKLQYVRARLSLPDLHPLAPPALEPSVIKESPSAPALEPSVIKESPSAPAGVRYPEVRPVGGQKSHLVADLAEATCLALVPPEVLRVERGDVLECWPLDSAPYGEDR